MDSCTVPGAGEGGPAVYDAAYVPLLWLCGIRAEFHDGRSSPGLLRENGQNLPFGNAEEGAVHGAVQRTYCLYPPYPGDEGRKGRQGGFMPAPVRHGRSALSGTYPKGHETGYGGRGGSCHVRNDRGGTGNQQHLHGRQPGNSGLHRGNAVAGGYGPDTGFNHRPGAGTGPGR